MLPCPGDARQPDFAAQQRRQLAADGEAEARAAVLAARAGVGLMERLEDEPLFFGRDADAGVGHGEGDGRLARAAAPDGPATSRSATCRTVIAHVALRRELERVRQEVLENLLQTLRVGA